MTQRTILFRGKLSHSGEWIEGNLIIARNGQPYIIPSDVFEPDGHHLIIDSDNPFWVNPATVGQFTGLTDKNGVKIFEGDIVKCPTATEPEENGFIVVYKSYRLFFSNVNYPDLNTYGSDNWEYFSKYSEVIGNIHTK